jgi:hypothetical protein
VQRSKPSASVEFVHKTTGCSEDICSPEEGVCDVFDHEHCHKIILSSITFLPFSATSRREHMEGGAAVDARRRLGAPSLGLGACASRRGHVTERSRRMTDDLLDGAPARRASVSAGFWLSQSPFLH